MELECVTEDMLMGYNDDKVKQLEYYISLLTMTIDQEQYPFFFLVVNNQVKEDDVQRLLHTVEKLHEQFEMEKQEGLLCYESIFQAFQLAVPSALDVGETIDALEKQGVYRQLMNELKKFT